MTVPIEGNFRKPKKPQRSQNKANRESGLVLSFCSFLALRSEDADIVKDISDYAIHKEEEVFAG